MSVSIPKSHSDLLRDETRAFAVVATTMPDGSPQATPVWFDMDGDSLCFNTARGRVKERNLSARPEVAIVIVDPRDPYRYVQIRGSVREITGEEARKHIDRLAEKYTGKPKYENYRGEERVKYCLQIESTSTMG
ncbi:MAG: PPOX class F420-dependent oxidoreductase [Anaerolineales bacterium]|jgi:PPOX class probable F420-dependent enzyme